MNKKGFAAKCEIATEIKLIWHIDTHSIAPMNLQ